MTLGEELGEELPLKTLRGKFKLAQLAE